MEPNWSIKENKQLLDAVIAVRNEADAKAFLRDLLTPQEIEEFSKRLEAARLLLWKVRYESIVQKTGLSSTTIARISKFLNGPIGGYRKILGRIGRTHHNALPPSGKGLSS